MPVAELDAALDSGGLTPETADKFVENVLGTYALPFGIAPNVRVNGKDYMVPMVVEEPSVIAAASNAAKMVRAGGGFIADVDPSIMTCQVQLFDVPDEGAGAADILLEKDELLGDGQPRRARASSQRGGGARDHRGSQPRRRHAGRAHLRRLPRRHGREPRQQRRRSGRRPHRRARRRQSAGCASFPTSATGAACACAPRVPVEALATETHGGGLVIDGIVNASRFAEADPYRAATHNKGIMNGIDAVCIATGNDWRAVEAGAHAFAARTGTYRPLATWRAGQRRKRRGNLGRLARASARARMRWGHAARPPDRAARAAIARHQARPPRWP